MTSDSLTLWMGGPVSTAVVITLAGLIIGSFLNVVVHRLPRMLDAQWRREAHSILADADTGHTVPPEQSDRRFNLAWPASHCPTCEHPLSARDNVPVLSYLWLKGRCRFCRQRISPRYPLLEALSGAGALLVWLVLPGDTLLPIWLLFFWILLTAAAIDLEHQLLPDGLTYLLLWLGLGASAFGWIAVTPTRAIVGAVLGYGGLWLLYQVFLLVTRKEGLGFGDFKLVAAFGAWLGPLNLPMILFLASVFGLAFALIVRLTRGFLPGQLSFGPFLAAAAMTTLLAGNTLWGWYWQLGSL